MKTKYFNKGLQVLAGSVVAIGLGAAPAMADVLYSDIPSYDVTGAPEGTQTSVASYENGFSSFGSVISPSTSGVAGAITVLMSNYATAPQPTQNLPANSSYNVDMSLTLYSIGPTDGTGAAPNTIYNTADLTVLDTYTQSFAVSYRPDANTSISCGAGNADAYTTGGSGSYSCGQINALTFNTNAAVTMGANYIWVATILNSSDPAAESLNWAINDLTDPTTISPTSNPQYETNIVNGVSTLTLGGTPWGNIGQGEIELDTVAPEPATFGLIGLGLLGLGVSVRRKSRKNQ